MSNRTLKRAGRAGVALAVGCAFAAVPLSAQAATPAVGLGTAEPFSVLAGSEVTNTLVTSMWGDLGLYAGSSVSGAPVVGGTTYINDAGGVAMRAKLALTTAMNDAATRPVTASAGSDLANQTFKTGVYRASTATLLFSSDEMVLDGEGDPTTAFIFQIPADLITSSATRVRLINRANPCNVFWQVGSSATLGSGSSFVGTVMADQSITADTTAVIDGRLLASVARVELHGNTIVHSACSSVDENTNDATPAGPTGGTGGTGGTNPGTAPPASTPAGSTPANQAPPASRSGTPTHNGTARLLRPPTTSIPSRRGPARPCTEGFTATVRGKLIRRVVFSLDGKRIGTRNKAAFKVYVRAAKAGSHVIKARVAFKDATRSKTLKFRYRACAAQALQPRRGPSQFTG